MGIWSERSCDRSLDSSFFKYARLGQLVAPYAWRPIRLQLLRLNWIKSTIPFMLLTVFGLLAVVSACSHSHEGRATAPHPHLTLPTRPLQWGDINIIHTTDSHGWLLGHRKTTFPEPNYRCVEAPGWNYRRVDTIQWKFRWFRVVRSTYENNCHCTCFFLLPCELATELLFRNATLIFCSLILEICTMVYMSCCNKSVSNISTGTGLIDGFPLGGIDAHDVRLTLSELLELNICAFRPINLWRNYHMI